MKRPFPDGLHFGPHVVPPKVVPAKMAPVKVPPPGPRIMAPRVVPPREGQMDIKKMQRATAKCVFKVFCPQDLVDRILGPDGTAREELERETGTKLLFKLIDFYVGKYQILGIFADNTQQIKIVLEKVLAIVAELGKAELRAGNRPEQGCEFAIPMQPGQYVFRPCISLSSSGYITGPGGATINVLRQTSGAKVFIDSRKRKLIQQVRLIGAPDRILNALYSIVELVQQSALQEEFVLFSESSSDAIIDGSAADDASENGEDAQSEVDAEVEQYGDELQNEDTAVPDIDLALAELGAKTGTENALAILDSEDPDLVTDGDVKDSELNDLADKPLELEDMNELDVISDKVRIIADISSERGADSSDLKYALNFFFRQECIADVPDEFIASLQRDWNTEIIFEAGEEEETPPGPDSSVTFIGPLPHLYAAHLAFWQKVKQLEDKKEAEMQEQKAQEDILALQAQIQQAKKQLAQKTIIGRKSSAT